MLQNSNDQLSRSYEVSCVLTSKQLHAGRAVCNRSLSGGQSLLKIIKQFSAMPYHKRAAVPKTSLLSFLPYCALNVLLLCRAHVLGRVLLHKEHGLVCAALEQYSVIKFKKEIKNIIYNECVYNDTQIFIIRLIEFLFTFTV